MTYGWLFSCCRRGMQQEGVEAVIQQEKQFLLTPLEKKVVELVKDQFENSLSQGLNAFAICQIHAELQQKFNALVAEAFPQTAYSSEQLNLDKLMSAIGKKTKAHVDQQLIQSRDYDTIEQEAKVQETTDSLIEKIHQKGYVAKVFTARQIDFLLNLLKLK